MALSVDFIDLAVERPEVVKNSKPEAAQSKKIKQASEPFSHVQSVHAKNA